MTGKDKALLQKIAGYIREINGYVCGLTFERFMADRKTISAVAFCVSQIGELAKEVTPDTQQMNPQIPWKSIRGMRNRIIHDYESVDLSVLWATVTKSLLTLLEDIENLLGKEGSGF